jgi:hypothetical protein
MARHQGDFARTAFAFHQRSARRAGKSTRTRNRSGVFERLLRCEALEDRRLLSSAASAAQQQTLADLPVAAQQSISSAIGQDQSAYHAASSAAGASLANPANGFTAQVQSGALQISAGADTWNMSLSGLGYGDTVQPVGTAQTSTHGNRVDCNYAAIDEWYVNGPGGLEQGFTVAPQPQSAGATGSASASLTVELALGGDLTATVNAAADGLTLSRPGGSAALSYTGLAASDATGKALPATLEVRADGGHQDLLIHVNTAGAQGPITIDPSLQEAKLTASDGVVGEGFGGSVSISGNTVVAMAGGAAYLFTESGSGWANATQTAKLTVSDPAAAEYGETVSISGNTVVVGAPYATLGASTYSGAAFVFTEPGSGWANMTQTATLTASDGEPDDYFGYSVSISGSTVVVGAPRATVGCSTEQGAAYVFTEPSPGWEDMTQTAELTASDGESYGGLGVAVSISGNTAVAASPRGVAFVFTEPGSGWANMTQTADLTTSSGEPCTAVSTSGNTVVVGALNASVGGNEYEGAAYVFTEPSSGWEDMTQTAELTPSDGATWDYFGSSVSISGITVVVGAWAATDGSNNAQGAAYVFTEPGAGWTNMTQTAKLDSSDGAASDYFGTSVSISGNMVAVGAPGATAGGDAGEGAAYVFSAPASTVAVSTSAAANSRFMAGGTVPITVNFSDAVTVSGTPQLALNDGGVANYASGSGTATLAFAYVVAAGENAADLDYASTGALTPNGGTIQDLSGNAAVVTLPATGTDGLATANIVIGTPPPVATVALNTSTPWADAVLTATATKWGAGTDPVSLTFVWSVDGTVKQTDTFATAVSDTFDLGALGGGDNGDTVSVAVTPSDGTIVGATVTATATVTAPAGFSPAQICTAYGIDSISMGSLVGNGGGQTIAIVTAYDNPKLLSTTNPAFATSDLANFDAGLGLPDPPSFLKLDENGGTNYPGTNPAGPGADSWEAEAAMDVEWTHAIASEANLVLVEAKSDSLTDLLAAVNTARNLPGVSVVSMSFGFSEAALESQYGAGAELSDDAIFTTPAGHQGVTFVAASGDNGSPGIYPADSPNVLAVGGTSLYINAGGTYSSEIGWSSSGGGTSTYEPEPSYQQGVQTSGSREIPDVAFDADPNTGVALYDSYDNSVSAPWSKLGGTSLGAPCWAGLVAIANQLRASNGFGSLDGPTQTLPGLYALPPSDFNDITSGYNGGYSAGIGYDMVTGLGTPIANKLLPDLASLAKTTEPAVATPGLYDPTSSWWYLRNSNATGGANIMAGYGPPGGNWVPLVGDWTGDGVDTIGLYNPATGFFYLHNSNTTGVGDITFFYGDPGQNWIPVVGDWTGQKSTAGYPIDSVGMYDPKTCTWYLRNELTTGVADITIGYGPPGQGWLPLVGDWDGIGTTTVGLYNPASGYFYLRNSNTTGVGNIAFFYGDPSQDWTPVAGDWTGDGHDSIGMYDPKTCTWYLRNELSTGVADMQFSFGSPGSGWLPVVGDWSGTTSAPAIAANGPLSSATKYANYVASNLPGTETGPVEGSTANAGQNTAAQGSYIDPTLAADEEFARLGSGAQLPAIDPRVVDRVAGSGDLDASATSLVGGMQPIGLRRLPGPAEIDAILAEPDAQ